MLASNSVGVSRPLSWRAGERREATPMSEQLEAVRRFYAEELRFAAGLRSPVLVAAFATVPRERFVGAGPWRIRSPMGIADYWTTDDADPRRLYQDVLVALDETRGINNGQPSLWAFLIDQLDIAAGANVLHLGCGTGYYTAIMAELRGADRKNHGRRDRYRPRQKGTNGAHPLAADHGRQRGWGKHVLRAG
jgi:hypothetical protein